MALDRLIEGIKRTHNPTVAGLDPKLEYIPDFLVWCVGARRTPSPPGNPEYTPA